MVLDVKIAGSFIVTVIVGLKVANLLLKALDFFFLSTAATYLLRKQLEN